MTASELVKKMLEAKELTSQLRIENSDNLDWYHFDRVWEHIRQAILELEIVQRGEKA